MLMRKGPRCGQALAHAAMREERRGKMPLFLLFEKY
jgi:hypothetical protein